MWKLRLCFIKTSITYYSQISSTSQISELVESHMSNQITGPEVYRCIINIKYTLVGWHFVTFCSSFMFTVSRPIPVAGLDTVFVYVGKYFTDSIYIVTVSVFQNFLCNQLWQWLQGYEQSVSCAQTQESSLKPPASKMFHLHLFFSFFPPAVVFLNTGFSFGVWEGAVLTVFIAWCSNQNYQCTTK